ncbi:hypothetical protein HML84_12395 [Alcanivorax sp. IO_7]|nr:hypothetical protein HML84_12395 [Alcanivorax sp. IO_7]
MGFTCAALLGALLLTLRIRRFPGTWRWAEHCRAPAPAGGAALSSPAVPD